MNRLVLDSSATLGFLLEDERDPTALDSIALMETGVPTYVPSLWWTETTNALLMAERRKRMSISAVDTSLQVFETFP